MHTSRVSRPYVSPLPHSKPWNHFVTNFESIYANVICIIDKNHFSVVPNLFIKTFIETERKVTFKYNAFLSSFKDSNRNQTLTEKNLEATSRSNSAAELHKYKFGK